jgi:hypothetical protein
MIRRKFTWPVSVVVMAILSAYICDAAENAGYFLSDGVGARALGMGGSFAAIADDATAAYWNPAGMTQIEGTQISSMYVDRFSLGVLYQFLNFVRGGRNSVGIGLLRLSVNDIPYVTGRDRLGHPIIEGTVKHSDNAVLISYGLRLIKQISIGVTVKGLYREMLDNRAVGLSVDGGALIRPIRFLSLGVNVQNIGDGYLFWDTEEHTEDRIPMNVKAGAALHLKDNKLIITGDVDRIWDEDEIYLHLGAEYWVIRRVLALRCGLRERNLTAGATLQIKALRGDYAYETHDLGESHRFSIILMF